MRDYDQDIRDKVSTWLLEPGNNFCSLPFMHMAIEANGAIRPCCIGKPFDLNIRNRSVESVFNDPIREEFVDAFRENKQHSACVDCWEQPFIRAKFSTAPQSVETALEFMNTGILPKKELKWLEVKPGNRCNLKCRICGVHNSSQWTKDAAAIENLKRQQWHQGDPIKFKDSKAFATTKESDWIDDPEFWVNLKGFEKIHYLHFMGGEPFMVPEHFKMLERMVADPTIDCSTIDLGYNTNGTYFPTPDNIELYRNFNKVQFSLSIDDFGPRFEYQRTLAEWDQVSNNLVKFARLGMEEKTFQSLLDPTVSIFNIFYLDEIWDKFNKLGYKTGSGNLQHFVFNGPDSITNLPDSIKAELTAKLANSEHLWSRDAVKYMNNTKSSQEQWNIFVWRTKNLDKLRKESFEKTFPEFWKLLGIHNE